MPGDGGRAFKRKRLAEIFRETGDLYGGGYVEAEVRNLRAEFREAGMPLKERAPSSPSVELGFFPERKEWSSVHPVDALIAMEKAEKEREEIDRKRYPYFFSANWAEHMEALRVRFGYEQCGAVCIASDTRERCWRKLPHKSRLWWAHPCTDNGASTCQTREQQLGRVLPKR